MQVLLEFAPLVAFFGAYYARGLYFATAVLMVAMPLLLLVAWLRTRQLPKLQVVSCLLVLVFGTATLVLRNADFIKWKPSIFLWILAAVFLGSQFVGREPLVQRMLQPALGENQLSPSLWTRLNVAWSGFYALLGVANIVVARQASEAAWVNFKVFGLTAAILVFVLAQVAWLGSRAARPGSP